MLLSSSLVYCWNGKCNNAIYWADSKIIIGNDFFILLWFSSWFWSHFLRKQLFSPLTEVWSRPIVCFTPQICSLTLTCISLKSYSGKIVSKVAMYAVSASTFCHLTGCTSNFNHTWCAGCLELNHQISFQSTRNSCFVDKHIPDYRGREILTLHAYITILIAL